MATQVVNHDPAMAIADRIGACRSHRLRQRHRRRRLPRPPAHHDARNEPRGHGLPASLPAHGDLLRGPGSPRVSPGSAPASATAFPTRCCSSCPWQRSIIFALRRTGFGRLLYAVGDNERATRLSGVLYWKVILALYITSALLAGMAGLLYIGLIKAPSLSLAEPLLLPSVAAAVIGGTSIFGGRGGLRRNEYFVGALILTVLTTLLTIMQMPEGARRILFGLIVLLVTATYLRHRRGPLMVIAIWQLHHRSPPQPRMKARRSGLMISGCVVHMPCGRPL